MPLYPPIEPHAHGMLDAGDGHQVYWETCGNPAGKPALVLHGGPGSGCTPGMRRFFDPAAYHVVLFDQRNCGRSTPHASDPSVNLSTNTTHHLLADIEQLREHLGIERWLLWGGSWGSTLALAYAETHPARVSEIILAAVTTTRPAEVDWLYHGLRRFFPEQWARFSEVVPESERHDLPSAYSRILNGADAALREAAAQSWCDWEDAIVKLDPNDPPNPRYADRRFRMALRPHRHTLLPQRRVARRKPAHPRRPPPRRYPRRPHPRPPGPHQPPRNRLGTPPRLARLRTCHHELGPLLRRPTDGGSHRRGNGPVPLSVPSPFSLFTSHHLSFSLLSA